MFGKDELLSRFGHNIKHGQAGGFELRGSNRLRRVTTSYDQSSTLAIFIERELIQLLMRNVFDREMRQTSSDQA